MLTGLGNFCCSAHNVRNHNWPEKADSVGEGAVPDIGSPMILEADAQPQLVLKSILWSM